MDKSNADNFYATLKIVYRDCPTNRFPLGTTIASLVVSTVIDKIRTLIGLQTMHSLTPISFLLRSVIVSVLFIGISNAQDTNSDVESIFQRYVEAMNSENINDVLFDLHTQSPFYTVMLSQLQQMFPIYNIAVTLEEFEYLGFDDTDRYAVVTQSFVKQSGSFYQDNRTKSVVVFRQEGSNWRIWFLLHVDTERI